MIITSNEVLGERINTTSNNRRQPQLGANHRASLNSTQPIPDAVGDYSQEMINNYKDKKIMGSNKWRDKAQNANLLKNPLKTSQLQIKGQNRNSTQVTTVVNQSKDGRPYGVGNVVLRLKQKDKSELSEIMERSNQNKGRSPNQPMQLTGRDRKPPSQARHPNWIQPVMKG